MRLLIIILFSFNFLTLLCQADISCLDYFVKDSLNVIKNLQGDWKLKEVRDQNNKIIESLNEYLPNNDDFILQNTYYMYELYYSFNENNVLRKIHVYEDIWDTSKSKIIFKNQLVYLKYDHLPELQRLYLNYLEEDRMILYVPLYFKNKEGVKYLLQYFERLEE